MRDRYEEFKAKGADVVAIGMGWPAAAADFREKQAIPFRLLVDHKKETYRVLEMRRGNLLDVAGPAVWGRGLKGIVTGHGVARPKEDPLQMGGVAIIDRGGSVRFVHRSERSSDNIPIDELLAHL